MTLADFLLARLAEEEADAHRFAGWADSHWVYDDGTQAIEVDGVIIADVFMGGAGPHIVRHEPARVLAEVAAKRQIVDLHTRGVASTGEPAQWCEGCGGEYAENGIAFPCPTLRALAMPYADHPDYPAAD